MILTEKQALAFVDAISKGAPKHFFDALLGAGQTPKVEDFTTDDAERRDKAEEFVLCVEFVTDTLIEALRNRPKQTSLLAEFDAKVPGTVTTSNAVTVKPKPAAKKPAAKKVVSSMRKFKDDIGKPAAKKKPTAKKKPAAKKKGK